MSTHQNPQEKRGTDKFTNQTKGYWLWKKILGTFMNSIKVYYRFVHFQMLFSPSLVSTCVVYERLSVMHKQVSGWTVNFCPNFPENPFLKFQTRKPPPPPISENFRFEMTKVYSRIHTPAHPHPHFAKLQIWNNQSLLRNTPPFWKTSD